MEERLTRIENKLDLLIKLVSEDVKDNCGKMGKHIDFVETVYENVKNPLGYICGKINYLAGNSPVLNIEEKKTIHSDNIDIDDVDTLENNNNEILYNSDCSNE